ncbi:hypothetical protein AUJ14_00750 [Candidatus Micrarchaeota archaeon CG1_02_55_22]|nr:MAG: hypothetical protein AUJ14_00750 [Candidatus Micrarchaeota archaeon CG1_02_55_22]
MERARFIVVTHYILAAKLDTLLCKRGFYESKRTRPEHLSRRKGRHSNNNKTRVKAGMTANLPDN